jgi:predicted PurR-regulated permease PerM
MSVRGQVIFWLCILALFVLSLVLLRSILLPFVLGIAIAYFLNPAANRLQTWGLSRTLSTCALVLGFFGAALAIFLLLAPTILDQMTSLLKRLPAYISALFTYLQPFLNKVLELIDGGQTQDVQKTLVQAVQSAVGVAGDVVGKVLGGGIALINFIALLAITPLVAFYLLHQWPNLMVTIDGLLPRDHADTLRGIARDIDSVLVGFLHGTAAISLTLAVFYAAALSLVGLNYALTIGLIAGVISFIPYVGAIFGFSASVGVALFQFWPNWWMVVLVLAIFFAGQLVTDYVLTPRIMGDRLRLHPLWVTFGLFAGGALFGFLGVLISVPVTAVVGVLTRFFIQQYKTSGFFLGQNQPEASSPEQGASSQ